MVTIEALAPFRAPFARPAGDPQPLPYLDSPANRDAGAIDIELEVWLQTAAMREAGHAGDRLSALQLRRRLLDASAQLVAHHTVNGCNLQPGDLFGTGTLSGPDAERGRLAARADRRRQAADRAAQRRDAQPSSRTATRIVLARLVRARGLRGASASASAAARCSQPKARS